MSKTTIKFGVHNKQIKVYAIIGKERKNKAILRLLQWKPQNGFYFIRVALQVQSSGYLKHLLRIYAVIGKLLKLSHYVRTVLWIGHSEPLACRVKHLACCRTVMDEFVNHERDEELALEILHILRVRKDQSR